MGGLLAAERLVGLPGDTRILLVGDSEFVADLASEELAGPVQALLDLLGRLGRGRCKSMRIPPEQNWEPYAQALVAAGSRMCAVRYTRCVGLEGLS